jgi:hypothetical protein
VGAAVATVTRKRKKGATVLMIKECELDDLGSLRKYQQNPQKLSVA